MTLSLLAIATLASGLLIGFIPVLIDGLQKLWQVRLNQPPKRLEWAVRLFYFSWLPAMPLAGLALEQWPNLFKDILFCGLFGLILGLTWLGMLRTYAALMGNMVLLGFAYSAVTTSAIRLMMLVLFPEYPELIVASLNLGFIAVGLGAMLGPNVVAFIERWWGYRQGLLCLSLACIVPAALVALSERDQFPALADNTDSWRQVVTHPYMVMIVVIILLYFAMESCLDFWPEPYLKELGYENRTLRGSMLLFWLAFIATRGAAAWWFYHHPDHAIPVTLVLVFLVAMSMGNLAGGYGVGSGSFGVLFVGACYGPLLPSLLGTAYEVLPRLPASGLGVLLSISGLDTLIVRPLMQTFTAGRTARTVMRVPIILALLLTAPLLFLAFVRN